MNSVSQINKQRFNPLVHEMDDESCHLCGRMIKSGDTWCWLMATKVYSKDVGTMSVAVRTQWHVGCYYVRKTH